jgi:hypothetical protein
MQATITTTMPIHNAQEFLGQALESVARQAGGQLVFKSGFPRGYGWENPAALDLENTDCAAKRLIASAVPAGASGPSWVSADIDRFRGLI